MRTSALRSFGILAFGAVTLVCISACGSSAAESNDSAAGSSDPTTLVLASIPAEDSESLKEKYALIGEVIEKETGIPVDFQTATDYAAVIEGQRAGKVHIASYGPFSYITAKDTGVELTAIATGVKSADAKPGYQAYGIVKTGSPIATLAGFRGKNICFVDPGSTSGYLYPSAGLLEAGIDPEKDITPVFAGGHDASVLAIMSGQCDAGFAMESMVDKTLIAKDQIKAGDITTIWKSETIAGSPVAISTDTLSPELQSKLTDIFQNLLNRPALVAAGYCTDEATCELPDTLDYGYVAMNDSAFDGVRKVCETTKAAACQN